MVNNVLAIATGPKKIWTLPILPEQYDRSPLTQEEWQALEYCGSYNTVNPGKQKGIEYCVAKHKLDRFNRAVADVYYLRHSKSEPVNKRRCVDAQLFMRQLMYHRRKMFWEWSLDEWIDIICQSNQEFESRYRGRFGYRATIMDLAYLFGGLTDLRSFGKGTAIVKCAEVYFGADLVSQQRRCLLDALVERGYNDGLRGQDILKLCLCTLFTLNRSPHLEEISEELLAAQVAKERQQTLRQGFNRIWKALRQLDMLPHEPRVEPVIVSHMDSSDMAPEWYAWCMAWYERAVDLSPKVRKNYINALLIIGRWLQARVPEIRTPEQWTEDLGLRFRSDVCSWTIGQYVRGPGLESLKKKYGTRLGQKLTASSINIYLAALKRFFIDISKHPYAVMGEPNRKIKLDFMPQEVFSCPEILKKEIENVKPRDINLHTWSRLVIAAATLTQSDLPKGTKYPLSLYRALALIWVTTARRPNEITRLRLECVRDDWDPGMLDEDDHPLEPPTRSDTPMLQAQDAKEGNGSKIYYLHIPSGKYRGPFWIWIPDYVASAIDAWKGERPQKLPKLFDQKDREYVDYLFCYKDRRSVLWREKR